MPGWLGTTCGFRHGGAVSAGHLVPVEGRSGALAVALKDVAGATLWQRSFEPEPRLSRTP